MLVTINEASPYPPGTALPKPSLTKHLNARLIQDHSKSMSINVIYFMFWVPN